ncbi:MAG: hypothetical protein IPK22_11055 [Verrucomicrobiaceae bacterium]|nr:hypothetical protein [Verrucomicrobiaceae bacterium]
MKTLTRDDTEHDKEYVLKSDAEDAIFAAIAQAKISAIPTHIYELVDATDEEHYYPLGLFTDLKAAIAQAEVFPPNEWDEDREDHACCEIRQRGLGLSGHDYEVLWRCEWIEKAGAGLR